MPRGRQNHQKQKTFSQPGPNRSQVARDDEQGRR